MASCVVHICTKNYQNLVTGFQVTIRNVRDVFLGHSGGLDFGLIYELGLTLVLTFVCGRKSVLRNRRITAIIQLDKLTL